ncbi:MAG: hypothetical protein V3S48_04515 [Candidatus Neomarinimicrobiota bacterium]
MKNLPVINLISATIIMVFFPSCAGDGWGLDEYGNELDSLSAAPSDTNGTPPNVDNFEIIQNTIFNSICAIKCHKSPRPKKDLNLEDGESLNYIVNVPSEGKPLMMRVKPFDPENSYLVWKLEGRDGISGKQMPLNKTPLEDSQIELIKNWISMGALP